MQISKRLCHQASRMDGNVFGVQIVPDQMQVVNPALVLLLIPLFDKVLVPVMVRRRVLENPLHRMAVGGNAPNQNRIPHRPSLSGVVAGTAFLSAGILELVLERTYPELPGKDQAFFNFINTLPCDVDVYNPFNDVQNLTSGALHKFRDVAVRNRTRYKLRVSSPVICGSAELTRNKVAVNLEAVDGQVSVMRSQVTQSRVTP